MKRQKDNNAIIFTSEDSGNTDNSYNSSFNAEKNENLEREMYMNRVNKMKDQINQMFTANPALKASLVFADEDFAEEKQAPPVPAANTKEKSELAKTLGSSDALKASSKEPPMAPGWSRISNSIIGSSMKQKKQPTLKQLNHRINIFKSKVKKYDFETDLFASNLPMSPTNDQKNKDKDSKNGKGGANNGKNGKNDDEKKNMGGDDEEEGKEPEFDPKKDIEYFSYRKTVQLNARMKKAEQEEKKRMSMSPKKQQEEQRIKEVSPQPRATSAVNFKGGAKINTSQTHTSLNTNNIQGLGAAKKIPFHERQAQKFGGGKDSANPTEREKKKPQQMQFLTKHAERLYDALHGNGSREELKSMAQAVINQFKKEKKEALRKAKVYPPPQIKFPTAETKKLQLFLPDFTNELYLQSKEAKDAIFSEITKIDGNKISFHLEDMNENIPQECESLLKINSILEGNLFKYWKKLQEQDF